VWSILFAGGGVRGGQVIGASDASGSAPTERPVEPAEVVTTIGRVMGTKCTDGRMIGELF
jgi:hypothetical protein